MEIKTFNYVLIILTVIGLFTLYLYTSFSTPLEISLLDNNLEHLEKVVLVSGTIKNFTPKNNHLFFEVCNYSKCLKAVYFNISKNNLSFLESAYILNKSINLTGKYTLYNDKPEIIIYKYEVT